MTHDSGQPGGYAVSAYAGAEAENRGLLMLPRSEAGLIIRAIPHSTWHDAMGPYPLLSCKDLTALCDDLAELRTDLVSVVMVLDPFLTPDPSALSSAFDTIRPFKSHYVIDLFRQSPLSRHHRRNLAAGRRSVTVDLVDEPRTVAAEWVRLYGQVIAQRGWSSRAAFAPRALERQLEIPGCTYFRAVRGTEPLGGLVCYLDRGVAYAHLIATTPVGRSLAAHYVLYDAAIGHFRQAAQWFDLGGVPGVRDDRSSGIARFKAGWATGMVAAYLGGRTYDHERSRVLVAGLPSDRVSGYFPPYRASSETGNE